MFFRPFFFYASPLVLMTPFLVVVLWLLIKTLKDVFFKNSRPGKYGLNYNNHITKYLPKKNQIKIKITQDAFFFGTTMVWFYSPSFFQVWTSKDVYKYFPLRHNHTTLDLKTILHHLQDHQVYPHQIIPVHILHSGVILVL